MFVICSYCHLRRSRVLAIYICQHMHIVLKRNISSRFSNNSEANASSENLEEMLSSRSGSCTNVLMTFSPELSSLKVLNVYYEL